MATNDGCDGYGWLLWFVAEGEVAAGAAGAGVRGALCTTLQELRSYPGPRETSTL